ncbi:MULTISPECIES: Fur family transcriptional regulator [Glycomyces]|uniref:Fur family ferric uptake transcriptional regulator n=2 Tax=Glycomyces TaxID=58113 RepID=A0A9X3SW72_9ACTN|nr:Fur family transcriptional regulator [Glycomyces lechevalierae]MDA1387480.1 Fur family transcriptional regulator [Glycomyces lechevalierae]MDR7338656.1 Fur family ferric uptake transcriptional regulator [Glycomyces lechevalierae]
MSDLVTRLRRHNWRITPQRRVIAETLEGSHVHFTAEEILERAVERMPELSRATVYNTLNEMVALGEVLELTLDGRSKRYDPNADHEHHHLICEGCGLMKDVHAMADPVDWLPGDERHGFAVSRGSITYRGLCPACQASQQA